MIRKYREERGIFKLTFQKLLIRNDRYHEIDT